MIIIKRKSYRWMCSLCFSDVFIVKTIYGDYVECPNCGLLMFEQLIDKHVEIKR